MKFSFLTYQFCRYPLEHSFVMAKEYGFEGIEVWGARPHAYAYDMDSQNIKQINDWKKKYNIEVSMFTPEILAYPYSLTSRLERDTGVFNKKCGNRRCHRDKQDANRCTPSGIFSE